ncbi:MAG: hypothetical protein HYU66_29760 [Armatimonadetes bacterium]|nr:hypothetical protein [Armatimonadota bacterium]
MTVSTRALAVVVALGLGLAGAVSAATYADPDGAFALTVPDSWTANRGQAADIGMYTQLGKPGDPDFPVTVLVVTTQDPIDPAKLQDVAKMLLGLARQLLGGQAKILTENAGGSKLAGKDAIRWDVTYEPNDKAGQQWAGYASVALGTHHAIMAFACGPKAAPEILKQADGVVATLAIESATPLQAGNAQPGGGGGGIFSAANLAATAQRVQGGALHAADTEVLVAGDPPLTSGSVANFAKLISACFGTELMESEYEVLKQQFITAYQGNNAQGKAILALGAANLLKGLQQGSEAERAKNLKETRDAMQQSLQNGVAAGLGWAKVLWDAIQRRSQTIARTDARPQGAAAGAEGTDNEMSEADLDAALEMLYFMWVASGRDASAVTPQIVQQLRLVLAQGFPQFPPQFQLLLANAQKVYSQVRGAWMQANPQQKAAMAQQFGQALDELGLRVPGQGGGGAWDNVDSSNLRADLVMNTCYNLAQKSTGGAWPSSPRD